MLLCNSPWTGVGFCDTSKPWWECMRESQGCAVRWPQQRGEETLTGHGSVHQQVNGVELSQRTFYKGNAIWTSWWGRSKPAGGGAGGSEKERWEMVWVKLSVGEELYTQLGQKWRVESAAVDWVAADVAWVVYSVFAFPSPLSGHVACQSVLSLRVRHQLTVPETLCLQCHVQNQLLGAPGS